MIDENCVWCGKRPSSKYFRLWYEDAHDDDCECWKCSAPACAVCYAEACPDEEPYVRWDVEADLYDALKAYARSLAGVSG